MQLPPPYCLVPILLLRTKGHLLWSSVSWPLPLCVPVGDESQRTSTSSCVFPIYHVQGTAMGSPVSMVVANLIMEDIEERALSTFHSPHFWKCYVADLCTTLHPDSTLHHLTSLPAILEFANIQLVPSYITQTVFDRLTLILLYCQTRNWKSNYSLHHFKC